jgi:adenine-specific DNA methylase
VRENVQPYLNIQLGDARRQPVANDSVDLVVTSSPYVTSYEYADLHQLSTIWLELAEDLAEYRQKFIGTAHKNYADRILTGQIANHIVTEMVGK